MHELKAILLVGGMGMRLRSVVSSQPKVLASVGGRPFLEIVIEQLRKQQIRDLVMCTGYLADVVENQFGDGRKWDISIKYSKEETPLGTGGALRAAREYVADVPEFLVANGDSFLEMDYRQFREFHGQHSGAVASIAVVRVEDASRYGTVQVDRNHRVTAFTEKTGKQEPGLVNGGIYLFMQAVFRSVPYGPASLERDVFPRLLDLGVYAQEQHGIFVDIGTPEDYERAQKIFCWRMRSCADAS